MQKNKWGLALKQFAISIASTANLRLFSCISNSGRIHNEFTLEI